MKPDDLKELLDSMAYGANPERVLMLRQKLEKKKQTKSGAELEKLFKEPNETK